MIGWRGLVGLWRLFRTTAFKLAIAYFIIFGFGFTLVIEQVGENVRELVNQQIRQTIDADIKGLADQYGDGGLAQLVAVVERRSRAPGASIYLVTAPNGVAVAGNVLELPAGVLDQKTAVEIRYERLGEPNVKRRAIARVFTLPGGFRLLIGHDLEDRERLRHILGSALFTSLLWLLVIATFGGLFVARRLLQRVDAMSAKAATLLQGDLTGRLPLSGADDELDRLARNLNAMLDRIASLMEGIRQVSDNIAHDLRTPLTRLRNNAEQALQLEAGEEGARAALEQVIEEADGLIRIFNALLMIARAESHSSRENFTDLDASELVRDMAELYEPAAEEANIVLRVEAPQPAPIHGQRELIGQAMANLIDNALKYGAPDLPGAAADVAITSALTDDWVEIAVADRGPGIPATERERVQGRFVRLEASRSLPGSGLGLSLAAAVARLHDGVLRIEDNAPGLRVVLALPRRREGRGA
ncbi:HAMP domain-containing protein [Rhodoblastus acidophilus]|uniref:histidine kinase n=1 Tax=Candidatus Rhodoblastus alkanivorans TaxID=2954117 RepID=A0ABS9Z5T3_9HYPH|nr:ATP-binding protein [Candidatus Rhodoblastus alkanivorans]MCI4680271.1 HAMP domain-containing protein [Candidatus Rhodoblastus alkanivorans]MCI4682740.1 HAMP domain-containing protein [Candidatus Rhodoblastus alkanivorans]MDI4640047.1 HAMP domain-containing protein [Rhodoblastus acidophilus]